MKIIADENMPKVRALFSHLGEVTLVNGRNLTHEQVKGADILLVRSVTKVNKALLEGSQIRFVGSATIGVDHIDLDYLSQKGIQFSSAPGCNAQAVADYVFSGLSHLYLAKGVKWLDRKIGIVGYGNVGKTVYQRFKALGCDVCVYDPLKQHEDNEAANFVSLADVLSCQVVSLHAPLTKAGEYPTVDMISGAELEQLAADSVIISAGRGGVINESALIARYHELQGQLHLVMDVWDGEPSINPSLLSLVDIATPHIAGYSKQGREKGSWMVYQALCEFLQLPTKIAYKEAISAGNISSIQLFDGVCKEEMLARSMHALYDVARDDARLRYQYRQNTKENIFDWLRKNYVERDEFNTCQIKHHSEQATLTAVGFNQS